MQEEIWKDIPNYEGLYQVSNLGRVKSLTRLIFCKYSYLQKDSRILTQIKSRNYFQVFLYKNKKPKCYTVHQIVAMVFLNHKPNKTMCIVVDHINNDKTDNRVDNLQLITQRENSSKDVKNKTSKYTGVSWDKKRCKWFSQIYFNKKTYNLGRYKNEYDAYLKYQEKKQQFTNRKKDI